MERGDCGLELIQKKQTQDSEAEFDQDFEAQLLSKLRARIYFPLGSVVRLVMLSYKRQ